MSDSADNIAVGESDIAVVGMSARFPDADNAEQFWENLKNGVESVRVFSDDELVDAGVDPKLLADPHYVKAQPYLEDIDKFDARFFGYSPAEARLIDPQQRIFLQCAWEALEDAGHDGLTFAGQIGVYGGSTVNTYMLKGQALPDLTGDFLTILTGCDKDFLATRVSYKLNLQGPSVTLQTACSTGLVAVHTAAQALFSGECDMALAGAVSIWSLEKSGYLHQPGGIVSPDGHCRAFDAQAQGTLFGNGAGIVVLRRLEDALADGDHIYAVVKGSAVNNDGGSKVGFSATSVEGQARVIGEALAIADVDPESISYVETHGTGTPLGDPVEMEGLCRAFRAATDKKGFCAIGSVKTNIGHMGAASGIAGFIKAVLALDRGMLPPSLHYKEPNPQIDFAASPFFVGAELTPWESTNGPRRAGVTSLGIGGTNAHVVLQEAPRPVTGDTDDASQLVILSAKTEAALEDATGRLVTHLTENESQAQLADVAYTLRDGRREFDYRRIAVCRDRADARETLASHDATRVFTRQTPSQPATVAFSFPGEAQHYVGLAGELYETAATFRQAVDRCCEVLTAELNLDPRRLLYPTKESRAEAARQLRGTRYAEAALFVVEMALAQQWQHWGIRPAAMIGHGVGEFVAACLAGVFSWEDAARLVALRGQSMSQSPAAVTISIAAPAREIARLLGKQLSILADDGSGEAVVAGPNAAVMQLEAELGQRGVPCRRLSGSSENCPTPAAFGLDELPRRLGDVSLEPPRIPFISGVTGDWITAQQATDLGYWAAQLSHNVRSVAGMETLLGQPGQLLLQVGPAGTLSSQAEGFPDRGEDAVLLASLALADGQSSDMETMLTSLGRLWLAGLPVDWQALDGGRQHRRVSLPTYPFRRERYWYDDRLDRRVNSGETSIENNFAAGQDTKPTGHPLLGRRLRSPLTQVMYESRFSTGEQLFLKEHTFYGAAVVPAVAYLEMSLDAARDAFGRRGVALTDVLVPEALVLQGEEARTVQTILHHDNASEEATVEIFSAAEGDSVGQTSWKLHAKGKVTLESPGVRPDIPTPSDWPSIEAVRAAGTQQVSGDEYYRSFMANGVTLGHGFQVIDQVWLRRDDAVCRLREVQRPALQTDSLAVDAGFQLYSTVCGRAAESEHDATYVPWGLDAIRYCQSAARARWVHVRLDEPSSSQREVLRGSVLLRDDDQRLVAEMTGLQFKKLSRKLLSRPSTAQRRLPLYRVQWQPVPRVAARLDSRTKVTGDWLILADTGGVGVALADQLRQVGHSSTLVRVGEQFTREDDGWYQIDPEDVEQYRSLLKAWRAAGETCRGVIHLWNLDIPEPTETDDDPLSGVHAHGCQSLLNLLRALAESGDEADARIWSVTRGALQVAGDTVSTSPAQSLTWGLGKTAALEHPALWGGLIDSGGASPGEAAPLLVDEITAAEAEPQVALRGRQRFVPRMVAFSTPVSREVGPNVRPDGSYLITGGMGGLGRKTAEWLVSRGARHFVLAGRGPVSAETQQWAAQLGQQSVDVTCVRADVSDSSDVGRLMSEIARSGFPLRGVVHAAGVLDDGILVRQDWRRFVDVLSPKVQGAWRLHLATRELPLDFFVLFSSVASVFGSPGQSSYAAANAWLDGLANYRTSSGLPALSVNWGPWEEVGMAAAGNGSMPRRPLRGLHTLRCEEALAALEQALRTGAPQAVVMRASWKEFSGQFDLARSPRLLLQTLATDTARQESPARPMPTDGFLDRWRESPVAGRHELMLMHLREQIAALLGMQPEELFDTEGSLDDIGLDSLAGIQLRDTLSKSLDCSLPATLIFDCPTIDAMADFLTARLQPPEQIEPVNQPVANNNEPPAAHSETDLDELSEDQLAALLDDKLAAIDELTAD